MTSIELSSAESIRIIIRECMGFEKREHLDDFNRRLYLRMRINGNVDIFFAVWIRHVYWNVSVFRCHSC